MPTLGTEIGSYVGNPNLGIGSGAPVVGAGDNNVINQTNRDLMMINHENNVRKYEQKIKDRDAELKLLAEGKVKTGEVLPQDRKLLDDMQKQNDKNYFDLISINDKNSPAYKQAYSKYQTGLRQTEDAATHAQYRYVGRKKLEKEQSDKTLDEDKQSYQNHLSNQDKLDFWKGDYAPYQKSLDFDADALHQRIISGTLGNPTQTTNKKTVTSRNGVETVYNTETTSDVPQGVKRTKGAVASQQLPLKAESTTFTKTDDNGRVYKVTEDQVDFDALKNNAAAVYNYGGKDAQQMMMLRDKLETMPDELYVPYMQHIMKRVNDYNEELGLKPGDDNYIDPKPLAARLGIDPVTGKRSGFRIMMTTPDFAALETLAQYNGNYKQSSEAYDKDASEFGLKKDLNDANIWYKHALGDAALKKANAYAGKLSAQIKGMNGEQQDVFLDEIYKKNIIQNNLITGKGGTNISLSQIPASNTLPVFTFDGDKVKILKPIGSTPIKDGQGKIVGYKGGHYEQQYLLGGKPLTAQQLADNYNDFKKAAGKNWQGSMQDYIKEAIQQDLLDVKLIGENGATDKQISKAAQKVISNKVTKKGQEGVFMEEITEPTDQPSQE